MNKSFDKLISYAFFVFVALVWGLSFLVTKEALSELDAIEVLAVRWGISMVFYVLAAVIGIVKVNYKGKNIKKLLPLVMCQPCAYSLLECLGVDHATASEASIIIAAVPVVVIVEEFLFLKKRPVNRAILGVVIAFSGVILCILPGAADSGRSQLIGYLFLIAAITVGGFYNIGVGVLSSEFSIMEISCAMSVSGGIFFTLVSLFSGRGLHPYQVFFSGGPVMWQLLFLGLGCGVLCYFMYNYNLGRLNSTIASCIQTNSINIVGVVAGILILSDPWGWYTAVGLVLMSTGIVICALANNNSKES